MSPTVQKVLEEAQQLSPVEQLDLIRALSDLLRSQMQQVGTPQHPSGAAIPDSVRRAPPITNLDSLVVDQWPGDETADDINHAVRKQRQADRLNDQ